jgi:hypothetical protein
MSTQELTIRLQSGETGVRAECVEFGVSVVGSSKQTAAHTLETIVRSHCAALVHRNGTGPGTPEQLSIAEQILADGSWTWRRFPSDVSEHSSGV